MQKENVKYFDRIVKKHNVFFSIDINTNGFTDQLIRLIFFYKVGNSLGLKYHYTPLVSNRSTPVFSNSESEKTLATYSDIYDFLGIREYLKKKSNQISEPNFKILVIKLDEIKFDAKTQESYNNLLLFLKTKISDQITTKNDVFIRFQGSDNVFLLYHLTTNVSQFNLPLREIYSRNREKKFKSSSFDNRKIKLIVHIRQGDTAIIKTPWESFIPVWYKIENRYKEVKNRQNIKDYEVLDVNVYYHFLKNLFQHFDIQQFSTIIYSDGFKKAFQIIKKTKFFNGLSFTKKIEILNHGKNYNQEQFKNFLKWKDIDISIGEEKEKLFDFVHSFIKADIVVFGTQEKLIPKLVAAYCNSDNMPLLINLFKKKQPNIEYLGIEHSSDRIIFVNLNDYDTIKIANRIKNFLISRDLNDI